MHSFIGSSIGIATKHQKDRVLAPVLSEKLQAVTTHLAFDTDTFGTFSGEVPRPGDQLTTLKAKAQAAAKTTELPYVVVSEGAVSSHPLLPGTAITREFVALYDKAADVFVFGQCTGLLPHVHKGSTRSLTEVQALIEQFDFPTHQVILKNHEDKPSVIVKDIQTEAELLAAAKRLLRWPWQRVHLETDVRADRHPERMAVIKEAGLDLALNLLRPCPSCHHGGFSPTGATPGLPCEACGTATELALSTTYTCPYCTYEEHVPAEPSTAPAAECPRCNP